MAPERTEKTLKRKKRCRCTPCCNKRRTACTRRRNYRNTIRHSSTLASTSSSKRHVARVFLSSGSLSNPNFQRSCRDGAKFVLWTAMRSAVSLHVEMNSMWRLCHLLGCDNIHLFIHMLTTQLTCISSMTANGYPRYSVAG
jgi:hypothetical protein